MSEVKSEPSQDVKQRVVEAHKAADEAVQRERQAAEADAAEQRREVQGEVEDEIEDAQGDAEAAQQRAEELVEEATEKLLEARRLADEGAEAAREAADEAQRQAQELAAEAEEQAHDAEAQVKAAEQIREHSKATAKHAARELQRDPSNGDLKSYNKPELVELAASIGIEGRTNMNKDELVSATRRRRAADAETGGTQNATVQKENQFERFLDAVDDSLDVPGGVKRLPKGGSGKALKAGLITVGGLAGLTAGSAGISSLRRNRGKGNNS